MTTIVAKSQAESTTEGITRIADGIVEAIKGADYAQIHRAFTKETKERIAVEALTSRINTLLEKYGKIQKLDPPRVIFPDVGEFPVHFENGVQDLFIQIDDEEKINIFMFREHRDEPYGEMVSPRVGDKESQMTDLEHIGQFKDIFQSDLGKVRLIVLLSPT